MWEIIGAIAGVIGVLIADGTAGKGFLDDGSQDEAAYDTLLMAFKARCKLGANQSHRRREVQPGRSKLFSSPG